MSTTLSSLCASISSGMAIPWPDLYLTNVESKGSSRSDRFVQVKAEKVKYVNKTGIGAWLLVQTIMDVTSNLSDLIPLSE